MFMALKILIALGIVGYSVYAPFAYLQGNWQLSGRKRPNAPSADRKRLDRQLIVSLLVCGVLGSIILAVLAVSSVTVLGFWGIWLVSIICAGYLDGLALAVVVAAVLNLPLGLCLPMLSG